MATSTALLQSTVGNILGLSSTAAEQNAAATGQGYAAAGDTAEQNAYTQAQAIATQNQQIEATSGRIEQFQAQREAQQTIGLQKAQVAGSGFQSSGTFLNGLQSSYRQADLTQQLIGTQTSLAQGGYASQAAAAGGEANAAALAATAATALGTADTTAAGVTSANQAAETAALMGYLKSTDPTVSTPEDQLITATINPNLNPNTPVDTSGTGFKWMKNPVNGTFNYGVGSPGIANPLAPPINPMAALTV
jgi:hypothetical protein